MKLPNVQPFITVYATTAKAESLSTVTKFASWVKAASAIYNLSEGSTCWQCRSGLPFFVLLKAWKLPLPTGPNVRYLVTVNNDAAKYWHK